MEIPTLTTTRLVLRPFRLEDLDAHAAMNADPDTGLLTTAMTPYHRQ